jgi:hypothetical protein
MKLPLLPKTRSKLFHLVMKGSCRAFDHRAMLGGTIGAIFVDEVPPMAVRRLDAHECATGTTTRTNLFGLGRESFEFVSTV